MLNPRQTTAEAAAFAPNTGRQPACPHGGGFVFLYYPVISSGGERFS